MIGPKAIIYCRVSSRKQRTDGESLENQEKACRAFCMSQGFTIYGIFHEVKSGNTKKRPMLNLAIENAKVNKIDYFVIFDIDRFSREGSEGYFSLKRTLEEAGILLRDSKNIISGETLAMKNDLIDMAEYAWNKVTSSEYAETILATVAKEERKKILQRTISREIQLEQQGYHVRPALFGFINAKKNKKPIQSPHPVYASVVQDIFKLKGEGLTARAIVDRVNTYATNKKGESFRLYHIHSILQNPLYAGILCSKWTNYQAIPTAYP